MTDISDAEIHAIVHRVLDRMMSSSGRAPESPAPAPQAVATGKKVVAIGG